MSRVIRRKVGKKGEREKEKERKREKEKEKGREGEREGEGKRERERERGREREREREKRRQDVEPWWTLRRAFELAGELHVRWHRGKEQLGELHGEFVHPAQEAKGATRGARRDRHGEGRSRTGVERGGERRAVELCLEEPAGEHSDSGPAAEERKEAFSR